MLAETIAILKLIPWKKVLEAVVTEAGKVGARSLLKYFGTSGGEAAVKKSIELFVDEFVRELTDTVPLSAAIPGYRDHLKTLVESAAPFLASQLQPEVRNVDLGPARRQWTGDQLPEDFSWERLGLNYERALKKLVKSDATLRGQLMVAVAERAAGPAPGFDLAGYREFVRGKCGALQLSAMHTSSYDLRLGLWNVFVAPLARESVAVRELPRSLQQRLREEGQLRSDAEAEMDALGERWQSGAVTPVQELMERERLLVILGDPGSGKSSLLKFRALQWANGGEEDRHPLPLWGDLKDFAAAGKTFLEYLHNAPGGFRLDFREIEERLEKGEAAFYLDGLDEIFAPEARHRVIEEIAALAAQHRSAAVVVTSRDVGYEPERLRNAGFAHATLEDFDDEQREAFVEKWHEAAETDVLERTRLRERLAAAVRDSRAIRDLAGNPLLLTMMALLNRNQDLPRDRVELYREASRVLLQEWDTRKALAVDTFGRQEKETLLRRLAGAMQQGEHGLAGNLVERDRLLTVFREYLKELGVDNVYGRAQDLVKQLEERNFILCYGGVDRFSFVHRTFLEYFCAAWFVEQVQVQQTLSVDRLKTEVFERYWAEESWHEVLRLITGMLGEHHADELIRFLMETDGSENKLANLMLAAGCLSEVRNRAAVAATDAALKERFLTDVIQYDSPNSDTLLGRLQGDRKVRGAGVKWIAFTWRNHATHSWLKSAATSDRDEFVREAAVRELARGWKLDSTTLPLLKDCVRSDAHSLVRAAAVEESARGWRSDPETLPWLKDWARSDEEELVRVAAIWELARGWKSDPKTLPWLKDRARSDEDGYVRAAAVREVALGWKSEDETLPWLKDRARSDEDWYVREVAVWELARGWKSDPETLLLLKECIRSAPADAASWVLGGLKKLLKAGWGEEPG